MKKKFMISQAIALLSVLLSANLSIMVNADNNVIDNDFKEIYSLADEIITDINIVVENENKEHLYTDEKVVLDNYVKENLDKRRLITVYHSINDAESIQDCSQKNVNYHYEYIANINDDITVRVTFTRNLSCDELNLYAVDEYGNRLLSDDEVKYYINNSGKWHINSIGIDFLNTYYESMIDSNINSFFYIPELNTIAGIDINDDSNAVYFLNKENAQKYGMSDGVKLETVINKVSESGFTDDRNKNSENEYFGGYEMVKSADNKEYGLLFVLSGAVIVSILVVRKRKSTT